MNLLREYLLALQLYDRPSLMAGKIHALITREYPKGRDWYDLLWYRGQRPAMAPNVTQLQNALDQSRPHTRGFTSGSNFRARFSPI